MSKQDQVLPATTFADEIARLARNPNCKEPGCYGRGYTGVSRSVHGDRNVLDLCRCARIDDAGAYSLIQKNLDALTQSMVDLLNEKKQLREKLSSEMERLNRNTAANRDHLIDLEVTMRRTVWQRIADFMRKKDDPDRPR